MTDRLTLTRALEDGGIKSEAADRIATEIFNAIRDNVATKADLHEVRAEIFKAMHAQTLTIIGSTLGLLGLLFTVLRLWPPH